MSESTDLNFIGAQKAVTTAGTREPLATGKPNEVHVRALTIKAMPTNTGNVYVGDSTVSSTVGYCLSPGETINFELNADEWKNGNAIDMSEIYLDVAVSGESVCYLYVRD